MRREYDKTNIKMTRGVLNSSTFDTFNSTAEGMQKNEGRDRITATPLSFVNLVGLADGCKNTSRIRETNHRAAGATADGCDYGLFISPCVFAYFR